MSDQNPWKHPKKLLGRNAGELMNRWIDFFLYIYKSFSNCFFLSPLFFYLEKQNGKCCSLPEIPDAFGKFGYR